MRALQARQLFDPVSPSIFLAWARDKRIDLPRALVSGAVDHGISLLDWKELFEKQKEQTEIANRKLAEARIEVEQLNLRLSSKTSSAHSRERNSLLKLVLGLAIKGYRFNPEQARNSATAEIRSDLEELGIRMDDATILKYLTEARNVVDVADVGAVSRKPNSPKR